MTTALITGASAGLGRALAEALARRGVVLVIDARGAEALAATAAILEAHTTVTAVVGDVTDPGHRAALVAAVGRLGGLDLLVHNASTLGPTPLRPLAELDADDLAATLTTNLVAPHALTRLLLPALRASEGTVLAISSDAAVEHYETWGPYAAAKAGLDHLVGTYAAEEPQIRWYAVDPGDMRTAMHQAAFVGEDISDRPLPEAVVPRLLRLLGERPMSGRYRAADLEPVRDDVVPSSTPVVLGAGS